MPGLAGDYPLRCCGTVCRIAESREAPPSSKCHTLERLFHSCGGKHPSHWITRGGAVLVAARQPSPRTASGATGISTGDGGTSRRPVRRSEEHTSELQSHSDLVCRLLLEKK